MTTNSYSSQSDNLNYSIAKMPIFMNPFQKHDVSDFPDVFIPLAHATRNASVDADHNEKLGISSDSPANDREGESNVGGANTVEGLRAEIDLGTLKQ